MCPPERASACYLSGSVPPLGLLSLAASLRLHCPATDVTVFDGELFNAKEMRASLQGDLVGLSVFYRNYHQCLKIARQAKREGRVVIFGGPLATTRAQWILEHHSEVDAVVVGDGNDALVSVVSGKAWPDIDNLVFREPSGIITSRNMTASGAIEPNVFTTESLLAADFSCLDLNVYWNNFEKRYPGIVHRPLPVVTRKGCEWREKAGCIFCSIPHPRVVLAEPHRVWSYLSKLQHDFGCQFFWEVSDSFTGDLGWLQELLRTRPRHMAQVGWYVYARPDELLVSGVAEVLTRLNVAMLYVGFESADTSCLKTLCKGTSQEQNREALQVIDECKFGLNASFIVGAPGENKASIARSRDFCAEMAERLGSRLKLVNANVLIPYPGSPAFSMLVEKEPHFKTLDIINHNDLTSSWVKRFCDFPGEKRGGLVYLQKVCKELNGCGQFSNRM